ncbi:MAG: DUF2817 domain-containing protein [Patescibacteria group bacterium]
MVSKTKSPGFDAKPAGVITIADYPVLSRTTCVTPTAPPKEKTLETITLQLSEYGIFKKQVRISTGSLPVLKSQVRVDTPISTKDPLIFKLDQTDRVFTYRLLANGQGVDCSKQSTALRCETVGLSLSQATRYDFSLQRLFKDNLVKTVFEQTLATVEPIQVSSSSIGAGQMVQNVPSEVVFTLNKPAESLGSIHLFTGADATLRELPITVSQSGAMVTVHFTEALPRSASFSVLIEQITAVDGGYLAIPFTLPFKTSGGPKVLGLNIGSAKVKPGGAVVITLDSAVAPGQAFGTFVRIESGEGIVAAAVSAQGRTITIKPTTALAPCAAFTVKMLDGLQNEFGVSGGSAWQFKSRTLCQTVFSIGTSVQGRSITAYRFGSGPNKIIFVGGTHGDEKSSVFILNTWIDQLELNPTRIPAHTTIIVIPNLNPDGYAAGRRTNANNVDLNRNFPSNSWKQGVTMPDKSYNANGGGEQPLSEPESRALANYVLGQSPRLVLTYHAAGSVVVPNDSGDSNSLAITYGQKSSVGYMGNNQTGTFFEYDTTGAFEDWLHDKPGIPALLVELSTKTSSDYNGHQNAMWYIAQLP